MADDSLQYSGGQLMSWLRGISGHNLHDQCCPDGSCCDPFLLAPKEEREAFVEAWMLGDTDTTERLWLMFFARLSPAIQALKTKG